MSEFASRKDYAPVPLPRERARTPMALDSFVSPGIQMAAREQADIALAYHRTEAAARGMTEEQAVAAALGETLEELFSAERDLSAGAPGAYAHEVQTLRMQAALLDRELGGTPPWGTGAAEGRPELISLRNAAAAVDREFLALAERNGPYASGRTAWDAALAEHAARLETVRRNLEASRAFANSPSRQTLCDYWLYQFQLESGLVDAIRSTARSEADRARRAARPAPETEPTERLDRHGETLLPRSDSNQDTLVPVRDEFAELSLSLKRVQDRVDRTYADIAAEAGSYDSQRGRDLWGNALDVHAERMENVRAALAAVRAERVPDRAKERELLSQFQFESSLVDALRSFIRRESDRLRRERDEAEPVRLSGDAVAKIDDAKRPGFFARAGNAVRRFASKLGRMAGFLALTSFNPAQEQTEPVSEPQAVTYSVSDAAPAVPETPPAPVEKRLVERRGETAWGEAERLLREQSVRPTNEKLVLLTQVILDDTGLSAASARTNVRERETSFVIGNAKELARRMAQGTTTQELANAKGYAWPMTLK